MSNSHLEALPNEIILMIVEQHLALTDLSAAVARPTRQIRHRSIKPFTAISTRLRKITFLALESYESKVDKIMQERNTTFRDLEDRMMQLRQAIGEPFFPRFKQVEDLLEQCMEVASQLDGLEFEKVWVTKVLIG